jgi:hypothetical protein
VSVDYSLRATSALVTCQVRSLPSGSDYSLRVTSVDGSDRLCSLDVSGPSGTLPTTLYRSRLIRLIMSSPV